MEPVVQDLIQALPNQLVPTPSSDEPVILDSAQPLVFWGRFIDALQKDRPVAIMDPAWPDQWKRQYADIARGYMRRCNNDVILIPTSGSTGRPRLCIHTRGTLIAAANAFRELFGRDRCPHAVNVLPPNHVGGIMPVFRSAVCGGKVSFSNYRDIASLDRNINLEQASISLVPTQLARMIETDTAVDVLKQFALILIGGAACPDPLLKACRDLGLRLAPCYGSTETAAMVTLLHPDKFLAGGTGVGSPLPGVTVSIGEDQRITVFSDSNLHGYIPDKPGFSRSPFLTDDLGVMDSAGNLHILGRSDDVIITGGKKVMPGQVETACWESGLVRDVRCFGVPDQEWGEQVALEVVLGDTGQSCRDRLESLLRQQLPFYAVPRKIAYVNVIQRNTMGKVKHLE